MTEKIKLSDLIYEVRARKLQPSQIFTRDEFEKDPEFGKIIKNEADYEIWKRDQEAEEELNEQMSKEIEAAEKEKDEFIPGGEETEGKDDNDFIPGTRAEEDSEDDLIPD